MTTKCPGCGGDVLPMASFCHCCGRRLAGPRPEQAEKPVQVQVQAEPDADANRRQVTVVFADLSGFTSLAETLDPETLRAFQNALFQTMAQAIEHYDGFVEKFVGDAVMTVFGAPRAHEDDPQRALGAAQKMMEQVERLSALWAPRLGRAVTLHIGVHTGAVVAGTLGSAAGGAYAVTGDTVNTASRLLTAAAQGAVLVSETTHALTQHQFAFEPAVELALRGKTQPMRAHRLLGLRAEAGSARGLTELGLAAPLIGRDAALEQMLAAVDRMRGGRAQLVSISGEAGAGKSRLLTEFFARLDRDDRLGSIAVRRAVCSSLGEPTYGTFGALFRAAYRVTDEDTLAVARGKAQQGLQALGAAAEEADAVAKVLNIVLGIEDSRPLDIEPEQLQRQITLAARALIELRLAQQPVMIVVDDAQWADAASIDLLGEVIDQLADKPLLVLIAQRPDARAPRCARAEPTIIELAPLGADDMRALVSHLLGGHGDDALAPVSDLVTARAGGNPLFIEEIVRSLAGRGLLTRDGDRWVCTAGCEGVDVPATLYGLLLARIDRLGGDERRTLQEAAVLGAEFDAALLRRIAVAPHAVDAALAQLAAADLIRASDAGASSRWCFTHALLHDVAYQNLLLARRTELHERAGRALEAALPDDARRLTDLEALGHHWSLSSDKLRGANYLLAAGDWARAVYANDDAMRHYQRALSTLPATPEDHAELAAALDARERLADLLGLQGRLGEALAHYDIVKQGVERRGEAVRAARVLRKIGGMHWEAGDRERASACFDAGLVALGEGGDPIERAHLFQEMGRLAFRAGDNATALTLAQRALDEVAAADGTAPAREVTAVRAQACNTLGVALARLGRPAEAVEQIESSVRQAEANEMLQAACRGYTNLGVLYASLDPQRSIDTCLRGLEAAKKVGDLGFQSRLYANLAVAYCALTNRCEAEGIEAAHAAATLDRRLGLLDHLAVPLIVLGQIHQCHGDHARAFVSYEEALQLAEQVGEPQLLFPCYDGLATLYLDTGRVPQAEAFLAKAQAVCERAGLEPDALMVLPFLC